MFLWRGKPISLLLDCFYYFVHFLSQGIYYPLGICKNEKMLGVLSILYMPTILKSPLGPNDLLQQTAVSSSALNPHPPPPPQEATITFLEFILSTHSSISLHDTTIWLFLDFPISDIYHLRPSVKDECFTFFLFPNPPRTEVLPIPPSS